MFPRMAKINFHECIDERNHFVIVLRLKNDNVIAFYSEVGLSADADSSKSKGFLSSLTNRVTFSLKNNFPQAKLFKYDPYYMEIGNSDLRIELHNLTGPLTSNIGMRHCYFDSQGHADPSILFGESEKTAEAVSYEVFQLLLD